MRALQAYLSFLVHSTKAHGVHSPFVFDLVTKCFYQRTPLPGYAKLDLYRKCLLADRSVIQVTDWGAGSRIFSSTSRQVCHIARRVGITRQRAQLLHRLTDYLGAKEVLELGTSLGLGTMALASAASQPKVISVEGCPITAGVASRYLGKAQIRNVEIVKATFDSYLAQPQPVFDLIFFDGHHEQDATLRYFEQLLPTVHNDTVWIFDDIHWSAGMQQAWQTICVHPLAKVTIDTYHWGLVFFRQQQPKEHFTIRL